MKPLPNEPIGERLRRARLRCRMTQQQLAEAAGVSQQTIAKIEKGQTDNSRHLMAFARILQVPTSFFDKDAAWSDDEPLSQVKPSKPIEIMRPRPSPLLDMWALLMDGESQIWPDAQPLGPMDRPGILANSPSAYALYVAERKAIPAANPGDIIFLNPEVPPLIGSDCAFIERDGETRIVKIRRITDITRTDWVAESFSPRATETIAIGAGVEVHRIVAIYRRA